MNNIDIICNEKGTGKTTFALKKYYPHIYFTKDLIEHNYATIIENTEYQCTYCIIDAVDSIPKFIFNSIMNQIQSLDWKSIILIFDIKKSQLMECPNFNIIWECGIIPRNYKYSDYIANKASFYEYFQTYYPELNSSAYDSILEITNFNFSKIDRLLLINSLQSERTDEIDPQALAKYIDEIIHTKYKDIPDAEILLKKASIIGEQFFCKPLESPNGFGYETASALLKQMDEMHVFIRRCINNNSLYEFVSHDVYHGIFDSISSEKKVSWIKILIQYYKFQYEHYTDVSIRLSILKQLNNLYKLLPSRIQERKKVCFILLYYYRKLDDTYHTIQIITEIVDTLNLVTNHIELAFIKNLQIQVLMDIGEYKKASKILQIYHDSDNYPGSRMLIKYYYAYCLYQTGNIDLSYKLVNELIDYLKYTSGSNEHPQHLFCMTYSLMATIQNHLGLDDNGIRYFHLALNNANSKLHNETYYFNILKKCDMFYDYKQTKKCLEACLHHFEESHNWSSAGEVSINLATEMMFQDCKDTEKIKSYFENALSYFSECENEKLAYAWNNFGIYYILVEDDIQKGLDFFRKALLVGLSDFSYMTIYLNICMCYILTGCINSDQFLDARIHFDFAKRKLNKRQHNSVYENIYEELLDILIDEYQGKNVVSHCRNILDSTAICDFFVPLLKDIIKRNHKESDSFYKDNNFYYMKMNQLHCFFAEFRFWE